MTSYVKQLKKVNYGIVVGLKVAQSELRRLRKVECDVQRNKSTTVVKNNVRMVKDLVTEKIGIEVSRQVEGQRLAMEQVDAEKCLAAGDCRLIGQWEHSDRRHAKEVEGRTARRAARNKYIKRRNKRGSRKASQAAPTPCGPILLTSTVCVSTLIAPTAVSSGAKGARQAQTVVAALVAEDDVLLLKAAADADVEVLVPPAVLGNAVSATVEGPGVLVFTALAVLDVDGDELLEPARAEVVVGTGSTVGRSTDKIVGCM